MRNRSALALAALSLIGVAPAFAQKEFELTPDSFVQPGVPQGDIQHFVFKTSKIFPGTERDAWVYVPKQYDGSKPACLMVFQDGGGFADRNGGYRMPAVFDNLIARGEMPVTIAIMVNPGTAPALDGAKALPRYNRSVEYDGMDDRYARFLIEELIPYVQTTYKLKLTDDPRGRGLAGASSGGIASFTAAWERPDYFGKVYGVVSSFTDLRGGHSYPPLIRKREPKPLRLFLQDGVNDQDIYSGSWPIGNTDVVAALRFAGYDLKYITGPGGHDGRQGTAALPEAMRWLWRGYPGKDLEPGEGRQPVFSVCLIPGENWKPVPTDTAIEALATDAAGNVYVAGAGKIVKLAPGGEATVLAQARGRITQLAVGPDNRLYAAEADAQRLAIWDAGGKQVAVHRGLGIASFAVRHTGTIFAVEAGTGKVWKIDAKGKRTQLDPGIRGSRALCLTPDQSLLLIAPDPASGKFGASLRVAVDETLIDRQDYHDFYAAYGKLGAGVGQLAVDTNGWLYAASDIGIQMLDQAGRVNGIVGNPGPGGTSAVAFGGPDRTTLYAVQGGKLFARKTKAQGALLCQPPLKPPGPRL